LIRTRIDLSSSTKGGADNKLSYNTIHSKSAFEYNLTAVFVHVFVSSSNFRRIPSLIIFAGSLSEIVGSTIR
jgi:hypothetical protein